MASNRRRNRNYILATAALFIIAVACIITAGCTASTSAPGLTGISWSLDSYLDENGTLVPVLPGTTITARFDGEKVAGSAGCNLYSGGYHQNGTALSFSTLAQTLKFCVEPEGIMEQEARFMELIGSAVGWRIESDRLIITNTEGTDTLVFVKGDAPTELTGTSWTLLSLAGEDSTQIPVIDGTTATAIFSADGNVGGNAGCNSYGASYTVDGANLSIKPTTQTEMYCETPGVMDQEDRYFMLLADVASYRMESDRLILTGSEGADLLVFEKAVRTPDLPLVGTAWVLDSYSTGGDAISSVIAGTKVTVMFADDGKISGNAGCNLYGGGYTLNGTNLSVSSVFSTLMYCGEPEGVMEQEGRYLGLLENVSSYRVGGDRLTLTDAAGMDLLFFVEAEKVPPMPLAGTEWTLESYDLGNEAISSVIFGTTITATFLPDGNVTGNAGCNRYFAAYEAAGSTMTIGPAGSTKMYCGEPEGTMEQEARYLGLLESVTGYRIDADRLDLLDEGGETLLTYRAGGAVQP